MDSIAFEKSRVLPAEVKNKQEAESQRIKLML